MKKAFSFLIGIILGLAVIIGVGKLGLNEPPPDTAEEVTAELQNKTCYYYNSLSDEQKTAYRLIYRTIMNFGEEENLRIPEADVKKVVTAVLYDNPEIFWTSGTYHYTAFEDRIEYKPQYSMSKEEADKISGELEQKIDEIVFATENMQSDFLKELYIHDYICLNCVYDKSTLDNTGDTVYSVLLNGKSICEGYAKTTQILLERVGIRNYLVVGETASVDGAVDLHMWNVVELDGKKYHLDTTWDDFDDDQIRVSHLYFNITDTDILYDHSNLQPSDNGCDFNDENYFHKNGTYIAKFDSYNQLVEPCARLIEDDIYYAEVKFASKNDFTRAFDIMENNDDKFFAFVDKVSDKSGGKIKSDEVSYAVHEESNYLRISFIKE